MSYDFSEMTYDQLSDELAEQSELLSDLGDRQRAEEDVNAQHDLELEVLAGFDVLHHIEAEIARRQ